MSPLQIFAALALLAGNAVFVATEFALMSARRSQIEPRAAAGSAVARSTLAAMENLAHLIATTQLGVTLCSLGLGAVAEPAVTHAFQPLASDLGIPEGGVHAAAFVVALALVIYLHVVLGEMVPKNLSLANPERAAMVLGPPMMALVALLRPVASGLDSVANALIRLLRIEPRSELNSTFTREEVGALVMESRELGLLGDSEFERLSDALDFTARAVDDVMLPLADLEVVRPGARIADIETLCARTGFSRFPVQGEDGAMLGYLHIKDVLSAEAQGRARVLEDAQIRPFANVPTGSTLVQALTTLQTRSAHLALVRAEDGRTVVGVAALEDVIEELVGTIRDEFSDSADNTPPAT
ncbi:MAG: hemolysin family protein [Marmoricola sp.]